MIQVALAAPKLRISVSRLACTRSGLAYQFYGIALIRKEFWTNDPDGLTGRWNWLRYYPYHGSAYRPTLSLDRSFFRLKYRRNFGPDRRGRHPLGKLIRVRMRRTRIKKSYSG